MKNSWVIRSEDFNELFSICLKEGILFHVIKEKVDSLDPGQMQKLVTGLLVAIGYHTEVSAKRPDGGVDILAYKDALRLLKPMLKTQIKHSKWAVTSTEVQQLLDVEPLNGNCLFISTGGFTSSALTVTNQYSVRVIDLEKLTELVVNFYEQMPLDAKRLIPLKRVYVLD